MKKRRISIVFILIIGVCIAGVVGFSIIEDMGIVDAVFMTIITVSTVGFEIVGHDLSSDGKIFTSILIIFSLGIFAYGVSTLTRYFMDGIFRHYFKTTKVKKRISKLSNHVIVCGYGRNGKQAVTDLVEHNEKVVIIERKVDIINNLREETDLLFVEGNATTDEVLIAAMVSSAKALITTFPNDADNLFVVLSARQHNEKMTIISRANNENSDKKLKRAGATNVIMPDMVGGQRMAKLVIQPDIVEFVEYIMLQSSKDVSLDEISCSNISERFCDKSIRELDIRNLAGANIVGLRKKNGNYIINPSPEVSLCSEDKLFVLGTKTQLEALKKILSNG